MGLVFLHCLGWVSKIWGMGLVSKLGFGVLGLRFRVVLDDGGKVGFMFECLGPKMDLNLKPSKRVGVYSRLNICLKIRFRI